MSEHPSISNPAQRLGSRKHRKLLRQLYESGQDPIALAQTHGLSLGQLVSFAEDPRTQRELCALIGLSDAAARSLLSRFRQTAVTRLARLASGDEHAPPETVRRACNDLLKLDIPLPRPIMDDPANQANLADDLRSTIYPPDDTDADS